MHPCGTPKMIGFETDQELLINAYACAHIILQSWKDNYVHISLYNYTVVLKLKTVKMLIIS